MKSAKGMLTRIKQILHISNRNAFILVGGVGVFSLMTAVTWIYAWSHELILAADKPYLVYPSPDAVTVKWTSRGNDFGQGSNVKIDSSGSSSHSALDKGDTNIIDELEFLKRILRIIKDRKTSLNDTKTNSNINFSELRGTFLSKLTSRTSQQGHFITISPTYQPQISAPPISRVYKSSDAQINTLFQSTREEKTTGASNNGLANVRSQRITRLTTSSNHAPTTLPPFFTYRSPITTVSCPALIAGNKAELDRANHLMENEVRSSISGELYLKLANNCPRFKLTRGYVTEPLTSVERDFPIAYSLLMFKDIEQAERLLRAIYRPQNVYCVHVDKKASSDIRKGMEAIARCFNNVFLIQNPIDVVWGQYSVLEPELMCMKELWTYKKWKYFINLTGQEFPLKTNFELVKILTAYNGANNLAATIKRAEKDRWENAGPPPHGYVPTKGSVHIAVTRKYVDFLLHNKTALDLLEWVKKTDIPDETYFATLNHNPELGVPGSYKGEPETSQTYPFLTRYKIWWNATCVGKYMKYICIFGVGSLPALTSQPHLFANKFYWDYQHYARDCLEEWHYNKTRNQYLSGEDFDVSFYKNLSFVKNHVK